MRYFIFFLQFVGSLIIASKLGPYYMGIWGFLLLILQYFSFVTLGEGYSLNILLVQNKNNTDLEKQIISSAFIIAGIEVFVVFLFSVIISIYKISYFEKYYLSTYIYFIFVISVLINFNGLLMSIYRIRNDIKRMLFNQGIVPILALIVSMFFLERQLIIFLLLIYIFGNLLSLAFFLKGFDFSLRDFSAKMINSLIRKGFFLLAYNMAFYFIIISTRTVVSSYYTIKEFGVFTLMFTLANSVFLILDGFSFLAFPKLIDAFRLKNENGSEPKLHFVRRAFITFTHGLVYMAICFYPLIFIFLTEYKASLPVLNIITLSLLIKFNTVGYSDTMMARDKEKKISIFSAIALIVNISVALILIKVFDVSFKYIIFSTLLAYLVYSHLVVYFGMKLFSEKVSIKKFLHEFFPIRLFLPYFFAMSSALIYPGIYSSVVTLILFVVFNFKVIGEISQFLIRLIKAPDLLNI